MDETQIFDRIVTATGISREGLEAQIKAKVEQYQGLLSSGGALIMIAKEARVNIMSTKNMKEVDILDEVPEDEIVMTDHDNTKIEELDLDDLGGKFVPSPKVGEEFQFTLTKIRKNKNVDAATREGKKFKTSLTSVDYKIEYVTSNEEVIAIKSWEVVGKVNAICRKLKKINGIELKVKHIKDGMKDKEGDNWQVFAKVDGTYKELDRKTNAWKA